MSENVPERLAGSAPAADVAAGGSSDGDAPRVDAPPSAGFAVADDHAPSAAADAPAVPGTTQDAAEPASTVPGTPAAVGAREGLSADELLAVLRAVFPPDSAVCYWCAGADAIGPLRSGLPGSADGWPEGRVWSARAEVRWRAASAGSYRALYLGEGDALPEGFTPLATGLRAVAGQESEGIYLWGTRGADGRYYSPRLPRALDYPGLGPMGASPRVPFRLLVDATGAVRFVRLALPESD